MCVCVYVYICVCACGGGNSGACACWCVCICMHKYLHTCMVICICMCACKCVYVGVLSHQSFQPSPSSLSSVACGSLPVGIGFVPGSARVRAGSWTGLVLLYKVRDINSSSSREGRGWPCLASLTETIGRSYRTVTNFIMCMRGCECECGMCA